MGSVRGQFIFQCPHCLQVGQGLVGGWGFGQDLAQCPIWLHLKQGLRVRSHTGGLRLMGQRG